MEFIQIVLFVDITSSDLSLLRRQPFHQRIPKTRTIADTAATTIPTTVPTDTLFPFSDGGIKSE